ncbi:hypothetical protein ABW19_dt0201664 [Dactylella cylindrospora]|nr:hypothetical protein ABW19_dt0201664 [Dactylella cylindrospora]
MASVLSAESIRDVAEANGVANLTEEVAQMLTSETEYRLKQLLTVAVIYMRQACRTVLFASDISAAARALDLDPPLGYQSKEPLRWGEATLGAGQPLFYIEDEEVDFEKIINAPLPKVPREVTITAHWTAIEGVQPLIPMNPSPSEARTNELAPKGATITHSLGAVGNPDATTVKPLTKHIVAIEHQMYFDRVTSAITNPDNEKLRQSAATSLEMESGTHQLLPYFVQYINEHVTHELKTDAFLMQCMMDITAALLRNENLFVDPYVASLVPPVITCMLARQIGPDANNQLPTYPLRDYAASIIGHICKRFGESSHNLKGRLARTFLKNFMDNTKPYATLYGAILGLSNMGVLESIRILILPNVKTFEEFIRDEINGDGPKKGEALACLKAIVGALKKLREENIELLMTGGSSMDLDEETMRSKLSEKIGNLAATEVIKLGDMELVKILIKITIDLP